MTQANPACNLPDTACILVLAWNMALHHEAMRSACITRHPPGCMAGLNRKTCLPVHPRWFVDAVHGPVRHSG